VQLKKKNNTKTTNQQNSFTSTDIFQMKDDLSAFKAALCRLARSEWTAE